MYNTHQTKTSDGKPKTKKKRSPKLVALGKHKSVYVRPENELEDELPSTPQAVDNSSQDTDSKEDKDSKQTKSRKKGKKRRSKLMKQVRLCASKELGEKAGTLEPCQKISLFKKSASKDENNSERSS